jgi:lysyl-tRNA synthetase class I
MTQRIPTRLVLTVEDVDELNQWLDELHPERPKEYIHLPYSIEPQLLGMRIAVDQYAKQLRVFFQES